MRHPPPQPGPEGPLMSPPLPTSRGPLMSPLPPQPGPGGPLLSHPPPRGPFVSPTPPWVPLCPPSPHPILCHPSHHSHPPTSPFCLYPLFCRCPSPPPTPPAVSPPHSYQPHPPLCAVPPQHQTPDVVTVSSVFQQRYECRLPPAALHRPPAPPPEARPYNGSGVAELLRPMAAAPCLLKVRVCVCRGGGGGKGGARHAPPPPLVSPSPPPTSHFLQTKDWWTYRFCYGKHIQQYHVEGVDPPPTLPGRGCV